jgi:hypothetical protein
MMNVGQTFDNGVFSFDFAINISLFTTNQNNSIHATTVCVNEDLLHSSSHLSLRVALDYRSTSEPLHRNLILCGAFLLLEVGKQVLTYSVKYRNHGSYPIDSSLLIVLCELFKLVVCFSIMLWQQGLRLKVSVVGIMSSTRPLTRSIYCSIPPSSSWYLQHSMSSTTTSI